MRPLFSFFILAVFCVTLSSEVYAQSAEAPVAMPSEPADILPDKAISLGENEENGVIAKTWIYRVPASDLQVNQVMQFPYLLFVQFHAVDNTIRIEKGIAAFKLESFDGERTKARKLEQKSGYFVAGLDSKDIGYPVIMVGCKLEDEKKRQFRYKLKTY